MKCMEFFEKENDANQFAETLTWEDADVEIIEGYMPNDDISRDEYEKHKEEYHGWFVWFNPKPML